MTANAKPKQAKSSQLTKAKLETVRIDIASGASQRQAAARGNINRGVLAERLSEPEVIAELDAIRLKMRDQATEQLADLYSSAVAGAAEIVADRDHKDRAKMIQWTIERFDAADQLGDVWVKAEAIWDAEVVEQLKEGAG